MPVSAQIRAPNLKQWKADGIKAAKGMTDGQTVRQLNIAMEQRSHVVAKQQFSSRGSRGAHGLWDALDPKYAEIKKKLFPGKPIMRRKDKLYNSLTSSGGDNISIGTNTALGYSFTMGTNIDGYPLEHQKGGTKVKGRPPMRKLLDPNNQTLRGFALAIARVITDGLFSRLFFEISGTGLKKIPFKYTGFEQVDIP